MVLNTVVGALATYGLAGLRYQGRALVLFAVIVVIQSLVAIQLMTFCVWLTPNQVGAFIATMTRTVTSQCGKAFVLLQHGTQSYIFRRRKLSTT